MSLPSALGDKRTLETVNPTAATSQDGSVKLAVLTTMILTTLANFAMHISVIIKASITSNKNTQVSAMIIRYCSKCILFTFYLLQSFPI